MSIMTNREVSHEQWICKQAIFTYFYPLFTARCEMKNDENDLRKPWVFWRYPMLWHRFTWEKVFHEVLQIMNAAQNARVGFLL